MGQKFANVISYFLHPLWMPVYVILTFWSLNSSMVMQSHSNVWWYILLVVFINTILIPLLLFWMLKKLKLLQSFKMEERRDRIFPFLIMGVFYLTTWFVFDQLGIFGYIAMVFMLAAILSFLALLITFFWKISIHLMSIGAFSVFILYLTSIHFISTHWPVYGIIMLSGILAWARLTLKSHNSLQVYSGFIIGAIVGSLFLMGIT